MRRWDGLPVAAPPEDSDRISSSVREPANAFDLEAEVVQPAAPTIAKRDVIEANLTIADRCRPSRALRIRRLHSKQRLRLLRFGYLAPDIVEAIVEGRQPRSFTVKRLLQKIPCAWQDQRVAFGFLTEFSRARSNARDTTRATWPRDDNLPRART
jgi:hypothetical protein